MKNLSIALNALLFVLVIILFVMVNNLKKSIGQDGGNQGSGSSVGKNKNLRIAYVDADTINQNYLLMKDIKAQVQAREGEIQDIYTSKAKKLQDEYEEYMQKKQAGNISEIDDQKAQQDMNSKQDELKDLQQQRDDLLKETQDKTLEIQKKIEKYIAEYNKKAQFDYVLYYVNVGGMLLYANDSLNITNPIISGLNREYKDSAQKAAAAPKH
jgi:outer membrane protein